MYFGMIPSFRRLERTLIGCLLILGATGCAVQAQKSYPGWSAPKLIPTDSTRATFPDIAADGDTLHLVFRSTQTSGADSEGPSEEELVYGEMTHIDRILKLGSDLTVETAGGEKVLKARRKELWDRLGELEKEGGRRKKKKSSASPVSTALYYTRSEDRGRTWWKSPKAITKPSEIFYGQTALHLDGRGNLHVAYTATAKDKIVRVFAISSENKGETWSPAVQVSTSDYNAFDPQLESIPGSGLILSWWELEETSIESKGDVGIEDIQNLIDNPKKVKTKTQRANSIIRYSRYIGDNWLGAQTLNMANVVIPYLNLGKGPQGEVYIYWLDDLGPEFRISDNGGVSWETTLEFAQVTNDKEHTLFLPVSDDYRLIRGTVEKRSSTKLAQRVGLLGGRFENIIDAQTQHSYPRIAFTKDEVQVVWGIIDQTGNHLLYFREDNKPPTSELLYPPDGDFTKYHLTFVWDATDDIATRLTYRWTLMKRETPDQHPEPHNWSLYDSQNFHAQKAPDDGYYTLFIQATDFSGNEEIEPTLVDFHTYFVPPGITSDPNSIPPLRINSRNIEILWKVEDNSPASEQLLIAYQLDGSPPTPFAPRNSVRISGLTSGWHQVQIFTTDKNGNISTFGETVSVEVDISLDLAWDQRPIRPIQGGVVFVKDERVPLSWLVLENTEDEGITYMSSFEVIHDEVSRSYTEPQFPLNTEISGPGGGELEEGAYTVTIVAQDEFGNKARNYIQTEFTVDKSPPTLDFHEPNYNEETKEPTISVTARDNYSEKQNLEYQFRILDEDEDAPWSAWSGSPSLVCAGKPIKFYSWGYNVQARARDIVGNVSKEQNISLVWYRRTPWLLYTLAGIAAVIVLGVLFLILTGLVERARARKLRAARKASAEEAAAETPIEAATEAQEEDDLFEVSAAEQEETVSRDDVFGDTTLPGATAGIGGTGESWGGDPFSTAETTVFDDPFAEPPKPEESGKEESEPDSLDAPPAYTEEPEPLELDFGSPSLSSKATEAADEIEAQPPPSEPAAGGISFGETAEPKQSDWSADEKFELDEHDLFDPLE